MTKLNKKYTILTFGCQMNHSDSERIQAVLEALGWEKASCETEADLVVVNSCAVRQKAMDRIYGRLKSWEKRKLKEPNFKTVLTGCVLEADKKKMASSFDMVLPIRDLGDLPVLLGHEKIDMDEYFDVKPKNNSNFSASVPIMTGCDKFCSYCAVPYTRGREFSRPYEEVVNEVRELAEKGYKEITLLGQNVNSYMGARDRIVYAKDNIKLRGTIGFPRLLQKVADIPGDFWIRFLSSHPYDMSDELIDVMARNPKVAKQINLAVQSGDNRVLRRMNRHYTVEHYKDRVRRLRQMIPDVMISTDIIVGFCGETEREFENTVRLFKEVEFEMAFISRYSPRPGTMAEREYADDVPAGVKKHRDEKLNQVLSQIAGKKNKESMGKILRVLVNKTQDAGDGAVWNTGITEHSKHVRFKAGRGVIGQFADVEITSAGPWSMEGILAVKS